MLYHIESETTVRYDNNYIIFNNCDRWFINYCLVFPMCSVDMYFLLHIVIVANSLPYLSSIYAALFWVSTVINL